MKDFSRARRTHEAGRVVRGAPGAGQWRRSVRRIWRATFLPPWRSIHWLLIGLFAVIAWALGIVGFGDLEGQAVAKYPLTQKMYMSLQLFVLETGWDYEPPEDSLHLLNVARFLAPAVAGWAILSAALTFFRDQVTATRVGWFARDHVLVCGLGRTGRLITQALRARGLPVVAIEKDSSNPAIGESLEEGATVFVGDASDASLLLRSRVDRARLMFVATGDDATAAKVVTAARQLVLRQHEFRRRRRQGGLTCYVRVHDAGLADLLTPELISRARGGFRIEPFNPSESGAPVLLNEFPPFDETGNTPLGEPHLLIVGLGETGRRLAVHAIRRWRAITSTGTKLRMTVVDRDVQGHVDWLKHNDPTLTAVCDVISHELDVTSAAFEREALIGDAARPVTVAYVCLGDDAVALSAALRLRRRLRRSGLSQVRIVVRTKEPEGPAALLTERDRLAADIELFDLLSLTTRPEVLLAGRTENLAKAIHAAFVRHQVEQGVEPGSAPAMVDWERLDEHYRESNRQQADDIGRKLAAIGCTIEPAAEGEAVSFSFGRLEIEMLARMEHDRWIVERESQGWRYGPQRDNDRKLHPDLVEWEDLSDEAKEKDRDAVRNTPARLAEAGMRIVRLQEAIIGEQR